MPSNLIRSWIASAPIHGTPIFYVGSGYRSRVAAGCCKQLHLLRILVRVAGTALGLSWYLWMGPYVMTG
jgi:hypothetical protein